ncbi:hypothetical protein A0127_02200 [Thermococcus peptonophilus]|uniref:Uncharacterized protein n=1 Tax=Thermococcus peptonophilus TaxID=53952 RepID=A0A142CTG4_9EURY|nr:hypothetical protein A0127_02200 [Thermococcus peptonophilus]
MQSARGEALLEGQEQRENGFIPEGELPLEWALVVGDRILAGRLVHASHRLEVYSLNGEKLDEIAFDLPGSVYPLGSDGKKALLRYESFTVPYRLYEFEGELKLIGEQEIEEEFTVEEDFATSKDGTKIHYFHVRGEKDDKKVWSSDTEDSTSRSPQGFSRRRFRSSDAAEPLQWPTCVGVVNTARSGTGRE